MKKYINKIKVLSLTTLLTAAGSFLAKENLSESRLRSTATHAVGAECFDTEKIFPAACPGNGVDNVVTCYPLGVTHAWKCREVASERKKAGNKFKETVLQPGEVCPKAAICPTGKFMKCVTPNGYQGIWQEIDKKDATDQQKYNTLTRCDGLTRAQYDANVTATNNGGTPPNAPTKKYITFEGCTEPCPDNPGT